MKEGGVRKFFFHPPPYPFKCNSPYLFAFLTLPHLDFHLHLVNVITLKTDTKCKLIMLILI